MSRPLVYVRGMWSAWQSIGPTTYKVREGQRGDLDVEAES